MLRAKVAAHYAQLASAGYVCVSKPNTSRAGRKESTSARYCVAVAGGLLVIITSAQSNLTWPCRRRRPYSPGGTNVYPI